MVIEAKKNYNIILIIILALKMVKSFKRLITFLNNTRVWKKWVILILNSLNHNRCQKKKYNNIFIIIFTLKKW